ncbi:MAG: trypsin-like peptidase domain-containing protein [Alphaproteobacteria bacterium]|nr:trypsin-like peptidase domain-containing protein [Alphaproteobacteria bacterium]
MFRKIVVCLLLLSFKAEAAETLAPVVKKVMPSVVSISTEVQEGQDAPNVENSLVFFSDGPVFLGSGFVAGKEGYILTNNHVIENAKKITVTTFDEKSYEATLVGTDEISDVALLKIEAEEDILPVTLGDSDMLEAGDFIFAIGNPFGLKNSVTTGVVSAVQRDIKDSPFDDYIQTDAAINPGNSGGPMFNDVGEVVGLNTVIFSKQGQALYVGFAIPSNHLKHIYQALKDKGTVVRSTIGAGLKETTVEGKKALIVTEIEDENLAMKNDLTTGDVIIGYEGEDIKSKRAFETDVSWRAPQSEIVLNVLRSGNISEKLVELKALQTAKAKQEIAPQQQNTEGMNFKELGLHIEDGKILSVEDLSEAGQKGVRAGDEILKLNGDVFTKTDDLKFYIKESLSENKPMRFDLKDERGEIYFVELMPKTENK